MALQVQDLSFAYTGTPALDGVSLSVNTGQFAVLLGPNGAGKSTLFSILSGLFSPATGSVRVLDHDLVAQPGQALAALGVVFQSPTLDHDLSVRQNLHYFADLQGLPRREAKRRINEVLDEHGLADVVTRPAGALSGGQRRRVELARSLLHRPAILLMDEPTVGLDIDSRQAFVAHVREQVDTDKVAVLWATHLADEVLGTDTVHLLDRGRLIASGQRDALFDAHGAEDIASLTERLRTHPDGALDA